MDLKTRWEYILDLDFLFIKQVRKNRLTNLKDIDQTMSIELNGVKIGNNTPFITVITNFSFQFFISANMWVIIYI